MVTFARRRWQVMADETASSERSGFNGDLELRVRNRRRNVFVTQPPELRELEDGQVKLVPVITQSPSVLLKSGVRTLQSTLVLKKREQLRETHALLLEKQQHFQSAMRTIQERRAELQHTHEESKERAAGFQRFVEENDLKRRRAVKKLQSETHQNQLKESEIQDLNNLLLGLQERRRCLIERVNKFKKYEEFLLKTLDLLPNNYLGHRSDLVTAIMRRYETLSFSKEDLLQHIHTLMEERKSSQSQLDIFTNTHNTHKLMRNQDLSVLQTQLDQMKEKNKQLEMSLNLQQRYNQNQVEEMASVSLSLLNLSQQCYLSHYGPLDTMNSLTTLDMIKEFLLDKSDLQKRASRLLLDSGFANKPKKSSAKTPQ